MKYEIDGSQIKFEFSGLDGPKRTYIPIAGLEKNIEFLEKVFSCVCNHGIGKSNHTKYNFVRFFINNFCLFLVDRGDTVPHGPTTWSAYIYDFMNFYLTTEKVRSSVRVKLEVWQIRIASILDLLRNQLIIPYETIIPRISVKTEVYNLSLKQTIRNMRQENNQYYDSINKLVLDFNFVKKDEEFLDSIMYQCQSKIAGLKEILLTHWNEFLSDNLRFNDMAREIDVNSFSQIIDDDQTIKIVSPRGFRFRCSPVKTDFLNWTFALVRHQLLNSKQATCISVEYLRSLPYFESNAFKTHKYKNNLRKESCMSNHALLKLSSANLLYRFAGVLSSIEVSVVCCLLIIEHPNFNPASLAYAKISSKNGKNLILSTDDNEKLIFSVDKPRARSRKSAILSDLARSIILKIIEFTAPIRRILRANKDPNAEYLFLGIKKGGKLGRNTAKLTDSLTGEKGLRLCNLYPELIVHELVRGTLSFRAIRNTMGVLRWFETGSIKKMSETLGNSEAVALDSYIPPEILTAWNTRIIRRHQNTLIILAAHNEPYLLEATDFASGDILAEFISQVIYENSNNKNLLSTEIKLRLDSKKKSASLSPGLLNIRLCETSLAYLYAYSDWATRHRDLPEKKISKDLIELAIFIKHSCQTNEISKEIENILDIRILKEFHIKALDIQKTLCNVSFITASEETRIK